MKKSLLFLITGLLFVASCKNDKKVPIEDDDSTVVTTNTTPKTEVVKEIDSGLKENVNSLFSPCDLITSQELTQIFGLSSDVLDIKKTSNTGKYANSCFLSWDNDEGAKNKLFLMLQINPLPGDFEDWSKSFLDAKINNGDMGYPDRGKPYKYKALPKFGYDAAYNDELKRVYWKANEEYVLAIFYNAGFTTKKRQKFAAKIAKIMNENLNSKL